MKIFTIVKYVTTTTEHRVRAEAYQEAMDLCESGEAEEVPDSFNQEVDYEVESVEEEE